MVQRRTNSFRVSPPPKHGTRSLPPDYSRVAQQRGERPSIEFDWDAALYNLAVTFRDRGYKLTALQQQRIDDHA